MSNLLSETPGRRTRQIGVEIHIVLQNHISLSTFYPYPQWIIKVDQYESSRSRSHFQGNF